jgi:hypothetical protein
VREAGGSFSQLYKIIVGISVCVGKRKTAVLYSWPPVKKNAWRAIVVFYAQNGISTELS